jgi:hypothetical protein
MIAGRGEANSRTHSRAALGAALSLALLAPALPARARSS